MKKELKSYFRREGEGVSLIPYFSTDKTLGTGCDMHFLCAMIANHVTLLAIFLLNFWAAGCSSEGGNFAKKNNNKLVLFSNFGNLLVPELIIKG